MLFFDPNSKDFGRFFRKTDVTSAKSPKQEAVTEHDVLIDQPWLRSGQPVEPVTIADMVSEAKQKKRERQALVPAGFPGPTTILFITTRSDGGIAPKQILDIIRLVRPIGLHFFIASPTAPPFGFELKKNSDRFISLPPAAFNFKRLLTLRKTIIKHHIALIHSHGRTAGIYAKLLFLLTGVHVIHTFHGVPKSHSVTQKIIDLLLGKIPFLAVFNSSAEKDRAIARKHINKKHEYLLLDAPIYLDAYPQRKPEFLAFSAIDPHRSETFNRIRIGGFLRPENTAGHKDFLKLATAYGGIGMWSCAGLSRQALSRLNLVSEKLEIVGPLQDSKKWLYSLDIFVSTAQGSGQVYDTLEAMAAGCVCILSNVPSHAIFGEQNAAILFDPKNPNGLINLIETIKANPKVRDSLLRHSRRFLQNVHAPEIFRDKLLNLYREAAHKTAN